MAHAWDFRSEGGDEEETRKIQWDWREAGLAEREAALCAYAMKVTHEPARLGPGDLEPLRAQGLSDRDVHDLVQVISYFNYINRVADALGTDLEPDMPPKPEGWSS